MAEQKDGDAQRDKEQPQGRFAQLLGMLRPKHAAQPVAHAHVPTGRPIGQAIPMGSGAGGAPDAPQVTFPAVSIPWCA